METSNNDSKINIIDEKSKNNDKNLNIAIYHKFFTESLLEILNVLTTKSETINLKSLDQNDKQQKKLYNGHDRLRKACSELKHGFSGNDSDYDQGRIIKKIYRVLTQYLTKLHPVPDKELFSLKNDEGATVTIIPGIDMQIVTKIMSDEEMEKLWDHMYMMYISSVVMITEINKHKRNGTVWEVLPKMRERVIKSGMFSQDSKLFNPFIGIMPETQHDSKTEYDVTTMFESVDKFDTPSGPSLNDMLNMPGMDKMFNVDQLSDQLRNVKPEEIEDATKNITKLLGAEDDPDVKEVCSTLVDGIVEEFKNGEGGIQGMAKIAETVSNKVGKNIDKKKMQKTANQLNMFLKDSEKNLKNMKDGNGNPIGEQIMDTLKGPLAELQKGTNGNGEINMSNMANIFSQVSSAMNLMKNSEIQQKNKKDKKTKSKQK